jgi:hypothetical protein
MRAFRRTSTTPSVENGSLTTAPAARRWRARRSLRVKRQWRAELIARAYDFFQDRHAQWAAEFKDYVLARNVPEDKFNTFVTSFAKLWIDGSKSLADKVIDNQILEKFSIRRQRSLSI